MNRSFAIGIIFCMAILLGVGLAIRKSRPVPITGTLDRVETLGFSVGTNATDVPFGTFCISNSLSNAIQFEGSEISPKYQIEFETPQGWQLIPSSWAGKLHPIQLPPHGASNFRVYFPGGEIATWRVCIAYQVMGPKEGMPPTLDPSRTQIVRSAAVDSAEYLSILRPAAPTPPIPVKKTPKKKSKNS